ncbi:MAG: glutamine synthetase [Elusimicrobia bacterium RIFOXYA12_FULL_51_18]|nr:MAG: glutamine synthetase [Elusimicrobia bacterium RIFOXYA12_FULL_51_18]OGS28880.1 MAG: glutamine synthetase [Elusimicrobia bacterium RIFOXYA2_FULL_53_38]
MNDKNKVKEILNIAGKKDIRFIKLCFVDILGQLKSVSISRRELEHALKDGMGLDGSSVEGFARIYESDLLLMPDPDTFKLMPASFDGPQSAVMFGDIVTPRGEHYPGDTRYILKQNLKKAAALGYTGFMVGPELEYFYFSGSSKPEALDNGGYFDTVPLDESADLRKETILLLEDLGIPVEYSHHEVAPSQHEIDLRYSDALGMADKVIMYKLVVKQVAAKHGVYASFMPKPLNGVNGSGMHVHQSLFKGDRNTFFDKNDPAYLSDTAKHYTAGILKHVRQLCAVTNQWVNSYKRLVPGFEAPVYIAWARSNRSALVRVPQLRLGAEKSSRIECRFPDPACNPYLAFSVMLAAGLDGVKNKLPLAKPVEADIYEMDHLERQAHKIETLPGSLLEAIEEAEKSKLLREALGEHVFGKFIENKRIEWDSYRTQVTDYEINRYLSIL